MRIKNLLLIILLISSTLRGQAEDQFMGGGVSYLIPAGGLSYRFNSTLSGYLYYGKKTTEKWEWYGKLEYISFNQENRDKLKLKRIVNLGGVEQVMIFDLPKLDMHLKAYGISVDANYSLLKFDYLRTDLRFGFGVYRWEGFRSEYFDTLRVEHSGITYDAVVLKVPALKQLDWSGGFDVGVNFSTEIIDPIWFELAAKYKAIIGEMWATLLELDLENVSVFQMYDLSLGVKVRF